jgi:DNA-binding beta-propeller fold protein YncE
VTVIDGSSNKVVATLPAGSNPYAMALDAAGTALFVANLGEPSVTQIDLHWPGKNPIAETRPAFLPGMRVIVLTASSPYMR